VCLGKDQGVEVCVCERERDMGSRVRCRGKRSAVCLREKKAGNRGVCVREKRWDIQVCVCEEKEMYRKMLTTMK